MTTSAAREARLRRLADRLGFVARKSRRTDGWFIVEPFCNCIVAEDVSLDDAEDWLAVFSA